MGLSTAERNRRKRERKKRERAQQESQQQKETPKENQDDIEIEYVAEEVQAPDAMLEVAERFQARLEEPALVSSDEQPEDEVETVPKEATSKRKLREELRPSVAELKRRVARPDLVEAEDTAAADPDFLIYLKAAPGTHPVPRHWGRKRKYLQGKRGFEKKPFRLPQFIIDTGIAQLRDSVMQNEAEQSAKQKNRARVTPKLGAIDVDYKTLHDAFFKHQTKPTNLSKFGDIYYEGKELEVGLKSLRPGKLLSKGLLEALGMENAVTSPPPWLWNMQRFGPPPSWSGLSIPGLNAPLPDASCQYGYHATGWGQPPVDTYGRPLYGGNPLDPPGSGSQNNQAETLVTSHGKTISKNSVWGALPTVVDEAEEEEDESSEGEMEESSDEDEEEEQTVQETPQSSLPPPVAAAGILPPPPAPPVELRKQGMETPKTLYKVLDATTAATSGNEVFASQHQYKVGAESVLSKVGGATQQKDAAAKGNDDDDDDDDGIGKNFKF